VASYRNVILLSFPKSDAHSELFKQQQCGGRSMSACSKGRRSVVSDQLGDSLHCAPGDFEGLSFLFLG
jgi:hypothetical protein